MIRYSTGASIQEQEMQAYLPVHISTPKNLCSGSLFVFFLRIRIQPKLEIRIQIQAVS